MGDYKNPKLWADYTSDEYSSEEEEPAMLKEEEEEPAMLKEEEIAVEVTKPVKNWYDNLRKRKATKAAGILPPTGKKQTEAEKAIIRLQKENDEMQLSGAPGGIIKLNNGESIFKDYNIFKDCENIHFHKWPLGGGIRFRFEDGSELQYNINEGNRDGFVLTKWRVATRDLILKPRPGQSSNSFVDYVLRTITRSRNYSGTTVKSAFMQYENTEDNRNILADFLELVERYVQVLIGDSRYNSRQRTGGRKTRKYKKKYKRKTRRVRKSRKKLRSRKSRKKRKISKSRKSRRRSSSRRRR